MATLQEPHVLFLLWLNRLQAALEDGEATLTLPPKWVKVYYRRAVFMLAMGRLEEAFVSFALCATLDYNSHAMKNEITRSL